MYRKVRAIATSMSSGQSTGFRMRPLALIRQPMLRWLISVNCMSNWGFSELLSFSRARMATITGAY